MRRDVIASAYALGSGGLIEAISKMSFGNMYGVKFMKETLIRKILQRNIMVLFL